MGPCTSSHSVKLDGFLIVLSHTHTHTHIHTHTHTYSKYTSSCSHLPTQSDSPISALSPAEIMLPSGNTHNIIVAYAQRLGRDARRLNATVALFFSAPRSCYLAPSELASGAAIIALKSARAKKKKNATFTARDRCCRCGICSGGGEAFKPFSNQVQDEAAPSRCLIEENITPLSDTCVLCIIISGNLVNALNETSVPSVTRGSISRALP